MTESLESSRDAPRVSGEDYENMVEAARASKDAYDVEVAEAAETRIVYKDDDVLTIVTAAMLVKFTLCWGDHKLQCSGDADALSRLPEILLWEY